MILSYLGKAFYCLLSLLRWKSSEQCCSVLLDFEQKLKKDWSLNSFLSILLVFNVLLPMSVSRQLKSLSQDFDIYIFLLLLLKAHIMFYHSRLQYFFLLCCFHSSLCPLFLFPVRKVPKLNEQEDKFLQEVFIIIILKCLKLGLVKM